MKTKEYVQVRKNCPAASAALVLAIMAAVMSAAALAAGIIALVKSCAGNRVTAAEYNSFVPPENSEDDENGDDCDEDSLGSDTLAF